jgi:hypothetical protein
LVLVGIVFFDVGKISLPKTACLKGISSGGKSFLEPIFFIPVLP